jgi:hypothetical protein
MVTCWMIKKEIHSIVGYVVCIINPMLQVKSVILLEAILL